MSSVLFQPQHYITSPDAGFLALGASVIMQAVEDVRLYLEHAKLPGSGRNAASRESARATNARAAAQWLQGHECRELRDLLAACGHTVPMKRLFRELQNAKSPSLPVSSSPSLQV
jgi:hypothetical protein